MTEQVSIYLTAMILGIMLFFSFVIAPVVFTTLDEDNARKFIRRIFPFYYNVNLAISFVILLIFLFLSKLGVDFYLILLITILFATSIIPNNPTVVFTTNRPVLITAVFISPCKTLLGIVIKVDKFFNDIGVKDLKTYYDPELKLVKGFKLRGLPTTILINKEGKEFGKIIGEIDFASDEFINFLRKYI